MKKRWYDYLWIVSLTYLVLGFFNIPMGTLTQLICKVKNGKANQKTGGNRSV